MQLRRRYHNTAFHHHVYKHRTHVDILTSDADKYPLIADRLQQIYQLAEDIHKSPPPGFANTLQTLRTDSYHNPSWLELLVNYTSLVQYAALCKSVDQPVQWTQVKRHLQRIFPEEDPSVTYWRICMDFLSIFDVIDIIESSHLPKTQTSAKPPAQEVQTWLNHIRRYLGAIILDDY